LGTGVVYYLVRKHAGLSLSEIGKRAGGVNTSAVIKMAKRLEGRIKKNPPYETLWSRSMKCLLSRPDPET
jgi:chromosomal replication initiation ATPase DnaA